MQHGNPLFPDGPEPDANSGEIPLRPDQAAPATSDGNSVNAALTVIREKLARIYAEAPDTFAKLNKPVSLPRSKHQQYMYDLQTSGRSLADIQTAWHNYYVNLPDHEKHEVWQEFYEANTVSRQRPASLIDKLLPKPHVRTYTQPTRQPVRPAGTDVSGSLAPTSDERSSDQLRQVIRNKLTAGGRLRARHHLQSLGFGLAIGLVTLVITLFSFFNEVIIAPFIQPGRAEGATPIIIDPSALATGTTPEVIIPKINLEIPVDYTQTSNDEATIQNALENGIVHYPSTVLPGQNGNAAFFGHSSNNIFNPGKYKFAFVLLHELQPGDTFYLTYQGKAYVYKVFKRIVVEPEDVSVLSNIDGHPATATLITCDPPGTALHRLVVVGDQITPDPSTNGSGQNTINSGTTPVTLPDNGPSLWDRVWGLFSGQ